MVSVFVLLNYFVDIYIKVEPEFAIAEIFNYYGVFQSVALMVFLGH
ncbi:hypothetical protein [Nostoc commune]|nr:hypothetical protein [Nostoc commune]